MFNERENVVDMVQALEDALKQTDLEYEVIVVDDGSNDGTTGILEQVQSSRPWLKIIQLRRNFGQTAALAAGFNHARGEVVITLDGDLQNDPADIPRLLAKLDEGFDVVSGWRRPRQDSLLSRRIPSSIANYLIGWITGIKLHDYGCTLKAYRREVIERMNLYGEMHRFMPAMAGWAGAQITEIKVNHKPRQRGKSKYGLSRTLKVILDLVTVKFLGSFSTKPIHIFGGMGLLAFLLSFLSGAVVLYQKFISQPPLSMNRNPLLTLTALLLLMSIQFLLMGLLAEMMCRTYHESQNKQTYTIRRIVGSVKDSDSDVRSGKGKDNG